MSRVGGSMGMRKTADMFRDVADADADSTTWDATDADTHYPDGILTST